MGIDEAADRLQLVFEKGNFCNGTAAGRSHFNELHAHDVAVAR